MSPFCRWDWLVDLTSLLNGVADEADICGERPEHVAVFQHGVLGLTVRVDVELCDAHHELARRRTGYRCSTNPHARAGT